MSDAEETRALPDGALEGVTLSGGYLIGEKLGKGGMAWVYEATRDETLCAVKILFSHMSDDEEFKARFLREARIQQELQHPNIVSVTDFIEERGLVGFVLEYCNGGTLLDLLKEVRGPIPLPQISQVFLPLVDAMGHAHREGVIHRDLKPPNILLHQPEGAEFSTPKLTDFGIAKLFGDATLTQTGTMIGTLLYMSPEQVEESKYVDTRADIYSLGVLLYQMVSGTLPFIGKSSALMMQILNNAPPPPPSSPKPLVDVIMKCLRKDPLERFADCDALAAAVKDAIAAVESGDFVAQHADAAAAAVSGSLTMSLQGSDGARPGGNDTIDDLDAIGEAHTLQLDTNDLASERIGDTTNGAPERATTPTDAGGTADEEPEDPEASAATIEAPMLVLPGEELLDAAVEDVDASDNALLPVDVVPPEGHLLAPLPSQQAERSSPVSEAFFAEPMPEKKPVPGELRQTMLLSLVAFGLFLTILALWLARDDQSFGSARQVAVGPRVRVRVPVQPRKKVKRRPPPKLRSLARKRKPPKQIEFAMSRSKKKVLRPLGLDDSLAALQQRCESGDAPSCRHWGLRLARSSVLADQHKAIRTMGHACDLRDLRACVVLGHWYHKGQLGTPISIAKARGAWLRACRLGARAMCFRLGRLWHEQAKVTRACKLYRRACLKQHGEGCLWQGWCLLQKLKRRRLSKRRRSKYQRQLRRLWRSACDLRSGMGCNQLGAMMSEGDFGQPDEEKVRRLFQRACALRSPEGCFNTAVYALAGRGGMPNPGLARGALDQACSLGDGPACYLLGHLVSREGIKGTGEQREASKQRATRLFADACRYKMAQGCYHAGYLFARGMIGVPSCELASSWLKQACALGHRPCRRCGGRRRLPPPPPLPTPSVRWRPFLQ